MDIDILSEKQAFKWYLLIFKRLDRIEKKLDTLIQDKAPPDRSDIKEKTQDALSKNDGKDVTQNG